jgi:ribosomal protein L12E/L44/L45/RPP1/RPP2
VSAETKDLRKLVEQAEAAVASVKDPELRRAAFEKVLERLLSDGEPRPAQVARAPAKAAASAGETRARKPRKGPQANVEELIEASFFKKPKLLAEVMAALEARGHHLPRTTVSPTLAALCKARKLRRRPGKRGLEYSNW